MGEGMADTISITRILLLARGFNNVILQKQNAEMENIPFRRFITLVDLNNLVSHCGGM